MLVDEDRAGPGHERQQPPRPSRGPLGSLGFAAPPRRRDLGKTHWHGPSVTRVDAGPRRTFERCAGGGHGPVIQIRSVATTNHWTDPGTTSDVS